MKTENQIATEIHDELVRELVKEKLELDYSHLREPIKKQDSICAAIMNLESKITLLEKRYKLS